MDVAVDPGVTAGVEERVLASAVGQQAAVATLKMLQGRAPAVPGTARLRRVAPGLLPAANKKIPRVIEEGCQQLEKAKFILSAAQVILSGARGSSLNFLARSLPAAVSTQVKVKAVFAMTSWETIGPSRPLTRAPAVSLNVAGTDRKSLSVSNMDHSGCEVIMSFIY